MGYMPVLKAILAMTADVSTGGMGYSGYFVMDTVSKPHFSPDMVASRARDSWEMLLIATKWSAHAYVHRPIRDPALVRDFLLHRNGVRGDTVPYNAEAIAAHMPPEGPSRHGNNGNNGHDDEDDPYGMEGKIGAEPDPTTLVQLSSAPPRVSYLAARPDFYTATPPSPSPLRGSRSANVNNGSGSEGDEKDEDEDRNGLSPANSEEERAERAFLPRTNADQIDLGLGIPPATFDVAARHPRRLTAGDAAWAGATSRPGAPATATASTGFHDAADGARVGARILAEGGEPARRWRELQERRA